MRFGLMANAASVAAVLSLWSSSTGALAAGQDPLSPTGRFSTYATAAAPTPPMGWNPWNAFRTDVDEAKVRGSALALVDTGLAAKGYRYVNIDDGWALRRLDDGTLRIRDSMFPSSKVANSRTGSFKPFTNYLHGLGLKAGIYSDIGPNTCAQRWDAQSPNLPEGSVKERQVGSFGHAAKDIEQIFGTWRFDYIKIDACGVADYTPDVEPVKSGRFAAFSPYIIRNDIPASQPDKVEALYATLGDAIRQWGGPEAVLSICAWGEAMAPLWAGNRGNLSRTSPDIEFNWASMLTSIDSTVDGALYAGPGHWNDPDMLAVGHGDFDLAHPDGARAHVTMWAIMAAPLLLGFDLRGAPQPLVDLVGNPEMIAVDQDVAGNQGVPYRTGNTMTVVRTLAAPGARAVALFNRGDTATSATVTWAQLGFAPGSGATVRDVWARRPLEPATDRVTMTLKPRSAMLLTLTGVPADASATPLAEIPARVHIAVDGLTPRTALPRGKFPARVNAMPDGAPIERGGRPASGIGLFANSRVEVRADGLFKRFKAIPIATGNSPVRYRVYADRALVAESATGKAIDADVRGARVIELVALASSGSGRPPMIAWSDAKLTR